MSAFTNPNYTRDRILAEIQASHESGLLRQGPTGSGTIVDLLMKGDAPQYAQERFGMPHPFVFAMDVIFNGLPREDAATWGIAFIEAITPRKDLSRVWAHMALAPLKKLEAYVSGDRAKVLNMAINYVERRTKSEHDTAEQQDYLNIKASWDLVKEEDETLYIIKSAVLSTRPVSVVAQVPVVADGQARALDAAAALRHTAKLIAANAQKAILENAEDPSSSDSIAAASLAASNASEEVYTEFGARFTTIVTDAPETKVSVVGRFAKVVAPVAGPKAGTRLDEIMTAQRSQRGRIGPWG